MIGNIPIKCFLAYRFLHSSAVWQCPVWVVLFQLVSRWAPFERWTAKSSAHPNSTHTTTDRLWETLVKMEEVLNNERLETQINLWPIAPTNITAQSTLNHPIFPGWNNVEHDRNTGTESNDVVNQFNHRLNFDVGWCKLPLVVQVRRIHSPFVYTDLL